MPAICKTCQAPDTIRDLIERMRTAGISYRDCAEAVKAVRQYDISHAAIQRHEVEGHFDPQAVVASQMPAYAPEDLSLKTIIDHKLNLWWTHNKDKIPADGEIRSWLKLWSDMRESEASVEEARALRDMFTQRQALPAITITPKEEED